MTRIAVQREERKRFMTSLNHRSGRDEIDNSVQETSVDPLYYSLRIGEPLLPLLKAIPRKSGTPQNQKDNSVNYLKLPFGSKDC
eukprot:314881-Amphidinium_carterae.1